jgi:hypothetical protein
MPKSIMIVFGSVDTKFEMEKGALKRSDRGNQPARDGRDPKMRGFPQKFAPSLLLIGCSLLPKTA